MALARQLRSEADRPLRARLAPKAVGLLTFRVSDAVRRRKVDDARTRGLHALLYVDFDFERLWVAARAAGKRTDLKADRLLSGSEEGGVNADGPFLDGWRLLFERVGASRSAPGRMVAPSSIDDRSCRVTTPDFRRGLRKRAVREVGIAARGSQ